MRTYIIEKRHQAQHAPPRVSIFTSFETDDEEKAVQYFLLAVKSFEASHPGRFQLSLRKFRPGRLDIGEGLQHLDIDTILFGDEQFILDALAVPESPPSAG